MTHAKKSEAIDWTPYVPQKPMVAKGTCLESEYKKAVEYTNGMVSSLRMVKGHKAKETEQLYVEVLLRHTHPLFVASVQANRSLKPRLRKSVEECLHIAETLDFSGPLPESVPVRLHLKKSGNYRTIHNHGIMHRTAQHAVNRVLGEYFKPKPFQFTHRGVHAAIKEARAAINDGHIYGARLDIKEFYQNFSADPLIKRLPLPEDVAEHTVVGRKMAVQIDKGTQARGFLNADIHLLAQTILPLACQGIPTGSATSSIVSMMEISRLKWSPMEGVVLINLADDFLVLATQEGILKAGVAKLTEAVTELPGGHFELILKQSGLIAGGFKFLGHMFYTKDGQIKIKPTSASMEKIYLELDKLEQKMQPLLTKPWEWDHSKALRLAATFYTRLRGYKAAFSACDDLDTRWLVAMQSSLESALTSLGVSEMDAKTATMPWMTSKNYAYMFKD